jgi:6-phosphogluconolactonase
MPYALYVCAQDDDKLVTFAMDPATGSLTPRHELPAPGGPSVLAISPNRQVLYAGYRGTPLIASFRINQNDGALTPLGTIAPEHAPTYLATDQTGRYLLSAYYQGGFVAVHPLAEDGAVGAPPVDWLATSVGAHAIQTDRSNRFAFVPHIARLNDNVLEPPKNNPGPNMISQFKFDAGTGHLTENAPARIEPGERVGPRHLCFHPSLDLVYFSDEQGCGVSSYRMAPASGTLSFEQRISSLPDRYGERNTCSQIHLTPSGRYLYVANRGHNSIAGFTVDPATGRLTEAGRVPTEAVPGAFALDPEGHYVFAAGTVTGRLASYRIDDATGALTPLATYAVGQRPAAVLATRLGQ